MNKTRKIRALFLAFTLLVASAQPVLAQAQERTVVASGTIKVGDRPLWRKIANFVTLGMVQATADTVKAKQPFDFLFDHDGIDTDGYTLYINTAQFTTVPVSQLTNGTITIAFPNGMPKGTYNFVAEAFGPGGVGTGSPLTLDVTAGNPSAPRNPRIIKK